MFFTTHLTTMVVCRKMLKCISKKKGTAAGYCQTVRFYLTKLVYSKKYLAKACLGEAIEIDG